MGELLKSMFYANNDVMRMEVFAAYEENALPQVLYENIEDVMEALFSGKISDLLYELRCSIDKAIRNMGMNPDDWSPLNSGSRPFEVIQEMVKNDGFDSIILVDPNLANKLDSQITQMMERVNPSPNIVDGAPTLRMMFPFTQELPAGAYDRFLASWSFSTRMLPSMTDEQIINEVWPELDRLLSRDGIAVIFPIGFYTNDRVAGEQRLTTEGRLHNTLAAYRQKTGSNLCWEFTDSQDSMTEDSGLSDILRWFFTQNTLMDRSLVD